MGKKDILLKDYFTPERFSDAINAIIFKGERVLEPAKIKPGSIETYCVENETDKTTVNHRFRDSIKVAEFSNAVYCLMAIEHESKQDPLMVLRILEYDVREYFRQIRENGNKKKLKPVITVVMYWKDNKWTQPKSLREMFDKNVTNYLEKHGFGDYIPDYRMHLFTPESATQEELNYFTTDLKDVIAYVKYSSDKDKLRQYAEDNNTVLNRESVTVINALTGSNLKIEVGKENVIMCEALTQIKAEGREIGRQEGSVIGFIAACREFGKTDEEIIELVKKKYKISKEEVGKLMKE